MHCKLKKDDIKQIDQRRPKSKIMKNLLKVFYHILVIRVGFLRRTWELGSQEIFVLTVPIIRVKYLFVCCAVKIFDSYAFPHRNRQNGNERITVMSSVHLCK